ncbi:hypothetical protein FQR65_LT15303 [Abscondita terminalis]|nr:hypothetical protein FQR65_LT15303 [Abscondita terminalis]
MTFCCLLLIKKTLAGLSNNFDDDAEESPIVYPANLPKDIEVYLVDDIENVPTQTQNINSIETFGELNNEENRAEVPKAPKGNSRLRPTTSVKPLTSSDVSKKCDMLMDRKLMLVEGY